MSSINLVNRYLESSDILTLTKDNIELTTKRITIRTHNKNVFNSTK
jgi:hypothetical protein